MTKQRHQPSGRMTTRSSALTVALAALGCSLVFCCALETAMLVAGGVEPLWATLLFPASAVAYGTAGLLAWRRRPSNRVGAVLVLAAWFYLLAGLANTGIPVLVSVGLGCSTLPVAVLIHLLLVYPSGRTSSGWSRAVIVWAYVTCTVFEVPLNFFDPPGASPLQIADRPLLDVLLTRLQLALILVAVLAAVVLVIRRYRAGMTTTRRALGPVAGYVLATIAIVLLSPNVFVPLLAWDPLLLFVVQISALAIVPIAFLLGMVLGRYARTGEIVELGNWLRHEPNPALLSAALADTLGDPTVRVAFWMDSGGRYVDADGLGIDFVAARPGTAFEPIELDGRPVGGIVYDATMVGDAELVRTAGRVLAIAVDRDRLTVELRASREALRESRARIVEEGDRARRQLARDLHDGLQGRLVVLAIQAKRLTRRLPEEQQIDAAELRSGLDDAIRELRRLVHDVMPALLIERGLRAATEDIVDRMPIPTDLDADPALPGLPPTVESAAFYVVAEGLANGLKHSRADRMRVRLSVVDEHLAVEVADNGVGGARPGGGLRGLEDRVDALGGRLSVESPPGGGTIMRALMPCA